MDVPSRSNHWHDVDYGMVGERQVRRETRAVAAGGPSLTARCEVKARLRKYVGEWMPPLTSRSHVVFVTIMIQNALEW